MWPLKMGPLSSPGGFFSSYALLLPHKAITFFPPLKPHHDLIYFYSFISGRLFTLTLSTLCFQDIDHLDCVAHWPNRHSLILALVVLFF